MKTCRTCGFTQPLSDFHRKKSSEDGHNSQCKSCASDAWRVLYQSKRDSERIRINNYRAKERDRYRELGRQQRLRNLENELKRHRDYYQRNKEKEDLRKRKYTAQNIDRIRAHGLIYRNNRRDSLRAKARNYYQNNKPKFAARSRARQIAIARASRDFSLGFGVKFLYTTSAYLTSTTLEQWHVDHIVPLKNPKVCGLHVIANLRVIPAVENLKKNNKFVSDWDRQPTKMAVRQATLFG